MRRCLDSIQVWADEIVVVDSQSTDRTLQIAAEYGASILQFHYEGGWPKKRQWALDNYNWRNDWILLLDADEILLPSTKNEMEHAIQSDLYDGYLIRLEVCFLGRMLRYGGNQLWKLSLFRRGKGCFEKRLEHQEVSMADMEVHEHLVVQGQTGRLRYPVRHENVNSLDRYIAKHNEYSNWEAAVIMNGCEGGVEPYLFGTQAQRRRWLKQNLARLPASPLLVFVLKYFLQRGFLDGIPGFYYCCFQAIQLFHVKAKLYELRKRDLETKHPL
jgi:glycosyltransferase involved in cell wall biosynthesis